MKSLCIRLGSIEKHIEIQGGKGTLLGVLSCNRLRIENLNL